MKSKVGQKATVTKGENKGMEVIITADQKEEIGSSRLFELRDMNGGKVWNGQFSTFPESFVKLSL